MAMEQKQEERQIPFITSSWIEKSNYLVALVSGYLWRVKRTKDASDYPYTSMVNMGFPLSLLPMNVANLLSLPLIIMTGLKSGMKPSKIFFLSVMMVFFSIIFFILGFKFSSYLNSDFNQVIMYSVHKKEQKK